MDLRPLDGYVVSGRSARALAPWTARYSRRSRSRPVPCSTHHAAADPGGGSLEALAGYRRCFGRVAASRIAARRGSGHRGPRPSPVHSPTKSPSGYGSARARTASRCRWPGRAGASPRRIRCRPATPQARPRSPSGSVWRIPRWGWGCRCLADSSGCPASRPGCTIRETCSRASVSARRSRWWVRG